MLSFTGSLKVCLAVEPTDMRKSFNGLGALVDGHLNGDLRGGTLYVVANRRRESIKILFWDGTGLWVAAKRNPGSDLDKIWKGNGLLRMGVRKRALQCVLGGKNGS